MLASLVGIPLLLQHPRIVRESFPTGLEIVDNPGFVAHILTEPDGSCVTHSKVPICINWHERIVRDTSNALVIIGALQLGLVDRPLDLDQVPPPVEPRPALHLRERH